MNNTSVEKSKKKRKKMLGEGWEGKGGEDWGRERERVQWEIV